MFVLSALLHFVTIIHFVTKRYNNYVINWCSVAEMWAVRLLSMFILSALLHIVRIIHSVMRQMYHLLYWLVFSSRTVSYTSTVYDFSVCIFTFCNNNPLCQQTDVTITLLIGVQLKNC
jgi:hypothetical protein